jgi:hypothetical protein
MDGPPGPVRTTTSLRSPGPDVRPGLFMFRPGRAVAGDTARKRCADTRCRPHDTAGMETQIHIRLPASLREQIGQLAASEGRPVANWARRVLQEAADAQRRTTSQQERATG